jgi:hypothetical protein
MIWLLCFVLAALTSPFKSKIRLEAENAALRHQLIVLRRKLRGRVKLANSDRWFFIQLYRWFPSILKVLTVIRPETPGSLASGRLSQLLALEVTIIGRAATDRDGPSRTDPADEHRKLSLGRAAHPR